MALTYGVDCSHWEGFINWPSVKIGGAVKFAMLKATEGTAYIDDQFFANKDGCVKAVMPWGAYHFFRPAQDPILQAQHFVEIVGKGCKVYALDVEAPGDDLINRVAIFMSEMERLGHKFPMIYTGPYFWDTNVNPVPDWVAYHDLWIANYEVPAPQIPHGWTKWKIWQFSDKGSIPGIPGAVDQDWFNGDIQAMLDYFWDATPPPPDLPAVVRVTATALNIRKSPNPFGVWCGVMPYGFEIHPTGYGMDGAGNKWWKSGDGYFAARYTEVV